MVETVFILDASGSMTPRVEDTIGGFNQMLGELDGEDRVSLVLFSDEVNELESNVRAADVPQLSSSRYKIGSTTSLFDAVGSTIDKVGARLSATDEADRPEKVVLVIMTDGLENSSKEYRAQDVKSKIEHQREKYGWEVTFIGADEDSIRHGMAMGVTRDASLHYDPDRGTKAVFASVSNKIGDVKQGKAIAYSAVERTSAVQGGAE